MPRRESAAPGTPPEALPETLAEIAEIAGRGAALAMAMEWGGRDIHIPKPEHLTRHPRHPLARLLDFGRAVRIARRMGGCQIYVPRARQACAAHLAAQGAGNAEIAKRLACSRHAVRRYRRGGI